MTGPSVCAASSAHGLGVDCARKNRFGGGVGFCTSTVTVSVVSVIVNYWCGQLFPGMEPGAVRMAISRLRRRYRERHRKDDFCGTA